MNIVPAEVKGRQARIDGHTIALERSYDRLPAGAKIEVGVRPEFVEIASPAPGLLAANIERIDDLGRVRFARVRVGDVGFSAKVPAGFSVSGNNAGLVFDPSRVHVYADSLLVEGAA
jgi:glycerol transport system ATP-binding protein